MKKNIIVTCALVSAVSFLNTSFADQQIPSTDRTLKPYIGVQGGYAKLNYGTNFLTDQDTRFLSTNSTEDSGLAGRLYFGLNFMKYLAAEMGFVAFQKVKFKDIYATDGSDLYHADEMSFSEYGGDLLLKVSYPFENGFAVFVKGGTGYIHRGDLEITTGSRSTTAHDSDEKWVPALGGGVSYSFGVNKQFGVDLSYLQYFKNDDLQPIYFGSIGLSYTF